MVYRVKKGNHWFFPIFPMLTLRRVFRKTVYFHASAKYILGDGDQGDINKLFGVGYLPHLHRYSARFGWVYNPETEKIELHAYCYDRGERLTQLVASVGIGEYVKCEIKVGFKNYIFTVRQQNKSTYKIIRVSDFNKLIGYTLHTYFGGNKAAPHEIKIEMK
jgi:hypothetical protein